MEIIAYDTVLLHSDILAWFHFQFGLKLDKGNVI